MPHSAAWPHVLINPRVLQDRRCFSMTCFHSHNTAVACRADFTACRCRLRLVGLKENSCKPTWVTAFLLGQQEVVQQRQVVSVHIWYETLRCSDLCVSALAKIMINRIMDARFSLKLISVWLLFLGNLILENPLKPQATLTASLPLCVYPLSPFFSFLRVLTFLSLSWAQQSLRNSSEVAWDCKGRSTAAQ